MCMCVHVFHSPKQFNFEKMQLYFVFESISISNKSLESLAGIQN